MACKHFQQESHNFNKHAKFITIDQLTNTSKSKETHPAVFRKRKFWILRLDTLYPKGFNIDLANIKNNNYNKIFLSCIRLSNIHFSPLQSG